MATSGVRGKITCTINLARVDATNTAATAGAVDAVQLPEGLSGISIAPGTGNGQCNEQWGRVITFASSTPQTFDLRALPGRFGTTIVLSRVKVLFIRSRSATYTHTLTIGNASTNVWFAPWSGSTVTETMFGGGCPMLKTNLGAGWVVDSTNRNLRIDPGSNAQDVEIFVAGLL